MTAPRTLVVSQRALWSAPWFSYCVEYETALASLLDASTVGIAAVDSRVASLIRERYRVRSALAPFRFARAFRFDARPDHADVAVIVVNDLQQLGVLSSIPGWRDVADRFIAIVAELWPTWLPAAQPAIDDVVSRLDAVYTTLECAAAPLAAVAGVPVHFLPHGVDTLWRTPAVTARHRVIGVSNRGRRAPGQHDALVRWSAASGRPYEFDTGSLSSVDSHSVHRGHFYDQCGWSRVYVTNVARFDQPRLHEGAQELGLRYFEGLAAGCVLAGDHPADGRAHSLLGDDLVSFSFPIASAEVPDDLAAMIDDDDAVTSACATNRALALRRHDVLHRWDVIADHLDLPAVEGTERRRQALAESLRELDV